MAAAIVGATGFVCGFLGDMLLHESPSNIAPILGIFVTGPAGFAIGLVAGLVLGASRRGPRHWWVGVVSVSVALGLGTFAFIVAGGFRPAVHVVELRLVACHRLDGEIDSAAAYWRERIETAREWERESFRDDWMADVESWRASRDDVVLEWAIEREAWIERQDFRGGFVWRRATPWATPDRSIKVLAGEGAGGCDGVSLGQRGLYQAKFAVRRSVPPDDLAAFLRANSLSEVDPANRNLLR